MWRCITTRRRLNAYVDDELSKRARTSVERHLAACRSCRIVLDGLRDLEPFLNALDAPRVPAALTSRILSEASLRQRRGLTKTFTLRWKILPPQPRLVTGATTAALIIGLAMGAYMGWSSYRDTGSGQYMILATENTRESLYAFDVLSAEPRGSIEAATLALLENGG